jgi:sugar phosphate isomerase/epimerase
MNRCCIFFVILCSLLQAQVPGYPVGRCVRVLGVTAPEDAKKAEFEYLELALQDLLPLGEDEFGKTVQRIHAIGLPALSGYGFMPAEVMIVGASADREQIGSAMRRGLDRAKRLGLSMVVYGNLNTKSRRAPEGFDAHAQMVAFGRLAAKEGSARGIIVLIEPMPAASTNTVNSVAEGLALVEEVNDPHFALLVDFGHYTTGKESPSVLTRAAKWIRQVEIQNPQGRVYPRAAGEADYAGFIQALKAGGYRGGFSIHGAPSDFWVDAPRAIAMLQGLLKSDGGRPGSKF